MQIHLPTLRGMSRSEETILLTIDGLGITFGTVEAMFHDTHRASRYVLHQSSCINSIVLCGSL